MMGMVVCDDEKVLKTVWWVWWCVVVGMVVCDDGYGCV